jgi:hypothetical protein
LGELTGNYDVILAYIRLKYKLTGNYTVIIATFATPRLSPGEQLYFFQLLRGTISAHEK